MASSTPTSLRLNPFCAPWAGPRPARGLLTGLGLLGVLGLAQAQTTAAPTAPARPADTLERVVVTGQAASLRSALDKQQAAQGVVNVVHADGIAQLPDNNAAEALARLPGVSVERDQGEGRFIRVRGLGPDYNSVNINGALTPASESDRRAPGLDLVPAGLIRALEVEKTLRPEQDANSLGGLVTVRTLSAFDQPGSLFSLELGANHDANAGKTRPRGALTWADRLAGGRLGVALALSADQRRFASDNSETGGAWDGAKLASFELRRYEITRERLGGALNLDFKPDEHSLVYLRSFSSRFTDEEVRQSLKISFKNPQLEGQRGDASATRGLKSRREVNRSTALVLGGERRMGDWTGWLEGGWARASEAKPDALASSGYKASLKSVGFVDGARPLPLAGLELNLSGPYSFDKAKLQDSEATDTVRHVKLDLQRELELSGWELTLKGGAKHSRRDKDNQLETYAPSAKLLGKPPYNLNDAQLSLYAVRASDALRYPWADLGAGISEPALRALLAPLPRAAFRDAVDSEVNDFQMRERVSAGYLQAQLERGATQWLVGLRHERLDFEAQGQAARDGKLSPTRHDSRSRHWLPALMLKQGLGSATWLRAALTHSVVRPAFGQLSPGLTVDGDQATLGNPELKPLRARNLDLGVEHRLDRDGALSAYVFHKTIRDFAFQTDLAGTPGWTAFSHVQTYANGDDARVSGLELSYTQALRRLPAPLDGLILGANASFTDSRARIGGHGAKGYVARDIPLPSQSDRSINLSLGWERGPLSTRLALNHKSAYLLEVGDVMDASKDRWVAAQNQVDFSLRWQITPRWQLGLEALNLGNARYRVYQGDASRNVQYEQYGRSYKLGLKMAMY
ncbi:TonB-dependent receptor [Pelomonas sp. CA6]|uniref:TonB-dependent receptor n=1 Tax=Pelomonas sp. CA6 TaxID=2907999 RepID=UPI001F4A8001|nr:TonB-dependent receptor [Pelomonas sp. CA6]MCH7342527.1 TonB-dependent receptor [Pelomonas sp. CA6]